jgi:YVTN family beta-propeller protein
MAAWGTVVLRALAVLVAAVAVGHAGVAVAETSVGPRQSSPIALTSDNRFVVNVNPDAHSITAFEVHKHRLVRVGDVAVGGDPSSIAIKPGKGDTYTMYVANALDGTVSVVTLNPFSFRVTRTIAVGAEPSAVALSPNGTRLYVANSSSNTLSVINTANNRVIDTIDLSPFGTAPRAIGVTNNGNNNDADETIFVALFFGQLRPGKTAANETEDDQREGRVVAISAATNQVIGTQNPVTLAPIVDTGFNANGRLSPGPGQVPNVASTNPQTFTTRTDAFPNQLAAVAIHPTLARTYVVSTGASPNGPFRFNSNSQGLVSVFNTQTRLEVTAAQTDPNVRRRAPLNLNQGINLATTPAPRLFLSNPVAMAWRPDGSDAWVVIQNSDVVVRLTVDANGIPTVGAPLAAGPSAIVRVDLQDTDKQPGKAPRGIVINSKGDRAFVFNFITRSVTTIDISNATAPTIVDTARSSPLPRRGTQEAVAHLGAELFFTGRGPDGRMSQESWGGCILCHPNGRADGVTWHFDAGPRQTIALDGMFNKKNPADQRALNWSAVRDENHDFELNTRGVFGGRGLIDDDRLFLAIGGATGTTPTDSGLIEQFQQFTGTVSTANDLVLGANLPTLLGARRDFAIATLSDDRVFIIGGRSGPIFGSLVGAADAVLEFNPRTNVIRRRSSSGFTLRHSLGAGAVLTSQGIRIYAVGGYDSTSATAAPVATVQEYNPFTDTWRTVAPLPTAVAEFGIAVAGGINTADPLQLIHVVSGNTGTTVAPSVANPNPVQRFQADPVGQGTWSTFPAAGLTPRRNHGVGWVLRVVSNRLIVIGGQDASGTVLSSVQELQTTQVPTPNVTLVNTPHTDLPAPRTRFGIGTTLTTNQIYIMGGFDAAGADTSTIFQLTVGDNGPVPGPAGTPSGAFVNRGNLSVARRGLQVSTPPGVTNFLPVRNSGRDPRQDAIAVWIALKVRSARAPVSALDPAAVRGRQLFGQVGLVQANFSCATCHGGTKWTRSTVDYAPPPSPDINLGPLGGPIGNERIIGAELRQTQAQPNLGVLLNVGTFTLGGGRTNELRVNLADIGATAAPLGANGFNIPSLLSVHESAPYFYSGLAQTLEAVLNGTTDTNGGVQHHFVQDPDKRKDLLQFLRSIDQRTPTFP